jgi:gliding motility-associated-like protein
VGVTVFNRSGIIVYKNDNYQNDWDGTFKGKAIPDGTYYYSVSYYLISGTVSLLTGDVTILR